MLGRVEGVGGELGGVGEWGIELTARNGEVVHFIVHDYAYMISESAFHLGVSGSRHKACVSSECSLDISQCS